MLVWAKTPQTPLGTLYVRKFQYVLDYPSGTPVF